MTVIPDLKKSSFKTQRLVSSTSISHPSCVILFLPSPPQGLMTLACPHRESHKISLAKISPSPHFFCYSLCIHWPAPWSLVIRSLLPFGVGILFPTANPTVDVLRSVLMCPLSSPLPQFNQSLGQVTQMCCWAENHCLRQVSWSVAELGEYAMGFKKWRLDLPRDQGPCQKRGQEECKSQRPGRLEKNIIFCTW